MQPYDRTSKWLIEHHGDAILRLAGVHEIASWRPLQAEVVQPRQLPDGLVEVKRVGRDEPELYVLELATYPDSRILEQVHRGMTLVYLDRRVLPEVLVLVLHPKGNLVVPRQHESRSPQGWTHWRASWRVVELWNVPAEPLLASDDPGLIPWVPLCRFDGPPEPILRECRRQIDRLASPEEHENLIAVIQVLTGLRYNEPGLLKLLGGREAMIESPVLQEIVQEEVDKALAKAHEAREKAIAETQEKAIAETRRAVAKQSHSLILRVLSQRLGTPSEELVAALTAIEEKERLEDLAALAAVCPDLDAFRQALTA